MIDMDENLSKLVLANNNLIIIYDITKSWYNILYYTNYISAVKICDDDKSLCVGFFNGYIYILNFGEIISNNYEQNESLNKDSNNTSNIPQQMYSNYLFNNIKSFSRMFPYVPVFEAEYINSDILGTQINDKECDNNGFVKNIPYINLGDGIKNVINKQKINCTKYKWHSHSVYNIITKQNKICSTGEEGVILIYNRNDASFEFISHLGSPCYYMYLNIKKNIIICNSLNNSILFINYNKRLFFYKYKGLSMPLKLSQLFYNNLDMITNVKKSFGIFESQLFDKFNYNEQFINKRKKNQVNILNDEKAKNNDIAEIEENDEKTNNNDIVEIEENDDNPKNNDIDKEDDGANFYNFSENENNEMAKKSIITFESIQNELEKRIYNNANIENNLYQNFQLSYFCGSNDGLICCFLTSFAHLQLYNVEKNKHIKNICPLNIIYKSRTDSEKVNDIELILYAINNTRNIIMTIEKRNYYIYGILDAINKNLIHTVYTIRFWIHIKNFDYYDMFHYVINKEPDDISDIMGNKKDTINNNKDREETEMSEENKTNYNDDLNNSKINTNHNIEKYKKIIPHPALSLFILLCSDGNITYWCLEKSDKILGDDIYQNFEIEKYEINNYNLAYIIKNTENETDIFPNNINNNKDVENNTTQNKLNDEEEEDDENENENEKYNIITVVKNINYKNTPILNGDISKDGGILCICHDTIISIWDCINLKTLAIINHPMYTLLNDYIFNLYKGIEIFNVENNMYMCYYSFDTLFIYSLNQFHLVHEKKFNGIIEYVKFDKHSSKMLAVGITKRIKISNDQKINQHHYDNTCLVQKNYLYKFSQNYLKKKKKFYLSQNKPIIAIDFAPINKEQSVTLTNYQDEAIIIALNSKFQICTFYFNNYPKHVQLR
ncbi:hypothetical protein YYC_04533 [Plasmodium yoelii 17X]|uniref:WD repeat-containing protein n=1 Tax=Plasmodium yoelii 17X TaxID=1323249 RepID=V7PFD7_PLAYE|nr:hypothetical protein YYC_04533 [Plasmodium yoelii 17X]